MKKSISIRVFFGLMIVVLGGILLLQSLGLINHSIWSVYWSTFWAAAFILAGLSVLFSSRPSWVWGSCLIAIGTAIPLSLLGFVDGNFWKIFWSIVLIAVGLSVALKPQLSRIKKRGTSEDSEKIAIFYGEESRVKGDYNGGSVTAIFGGVELDLRQAKVEDGAVIDVFTFCGGIEMNVPDDVIVQNEVRGILGGSEDKSVSKPSAKKKLCIRGECILGGLEIK